MIASGEWLTATRASGIVSYGIALTCCGIAWARTRGEPTVSRIAAWLTAIEGILLLDMIFNSRWILHQLLLDFAQSLLEYDLRRLPQVIVVALLAGMLFVGLFSDPRLFRARIGALLAVSGVLLSLVTWCIRHAEIHRKLTAISLPIG
jgi:hypothetical protein